MNIYTALKNTLEAFTFESILVRLLLATLSGFMIGMDRELRSQNAGIRTHIVVSVGSALTMLIGEYMYFKFPQANIDMTRIGSYVVSGIGFLGVGMIVITQQNRVKGLTTAAGLWACAANGLAIGAGFLDGWLISLIIITVSLLGLHRVDDLLRKNSKHFTIYVELTEPRAIKLFIAMLRKNNINFSDVEVNKGKLKGEGPMITLSINLDKMSKQEFLNLLRGSDEVLYFEEF